MNPSKLAPRYRAFRIVYALLTLNFVVPAISYIAQPEALLGSMDLINRTLGGGPFSDPASLGVWHMLAVGNVMTLGFMCALLFHDLRRFYPALPALAFLKGFSSLYSLAIGLAHHVPVFLFVFVLDGVTTFAMIFFAVRAYPVAPMGGEARITDNLEKIAAAGIVPVVPNRFQLLCGVVRMWHRVIFRSSTIGTSRGSVRATRHARLLENRVVRFFPLVLEKAIAPLDFTGLKSSPERVMHHLVAAHHDGDQFVYDLELLACHPGRLTELRAMAAEIVAQDTPRTRWLRDLVVYDGYHENLLAAVDAALAGNLECARPDDPDISLRGYLAWCARQPASLSALLRQPTWKQATIR